MTNCFRAGGCAGSHYPFLTQQERDIETGLDFFISRYYSSIQGRFASADLFQGFAANPQTLNLYSYVQNNPLAFVDPDGHASLSAEGVRRDLFLYPVSIPEGKRWSFCGSDCGGDTASQDPRGVTVISAPLPEGGVSVRITPIAFVDENEDNSCMYCRDFAREMHKRAVPMGKVIETYAEVELTVFSLPVGGMVRLGSNSKRGFDFALGLGKYLPKFADETGSLMYTQITRDATFIPENFFAIANRAKAIRFNTQGIDWHQWARWAIRDQKLSVSRGTVTNWELHQILINPKLLKKTVFY